jgi:hypothetical protein
MSFFIIQNNVNNNMFQYSAFSLDYDELIKEIF